MVTVVRRGRWAARFSCIALTLAAAATGALATHNNPCDEPGDAPDVIVGDLHETNSYGSLNSGGVQISAFSVGTVSCNIGTCWLNWFQNSNQHPVIGQNMFRLKDGRFEQIGQSWLKHGFFALSQGLCFSDCLPTDGTHLGVHCSDPYSASLNGQQTNLGPKFEVNATTGEYPWPFFLRGVSGNTIFKRLQVKNTDLNPALNPGARYFVEGQYVSNDDALAGNGLNNASYRKISILGAEPTYTIVLDGMTQREKAGIAAWKDTDSGVNLTQVFADGMFIVGSRVTDLGNGNWHYEYAVQNVNSFRSAGSFTVPLPFGANVQNIGFHDVDYHSGEPYDGTDWTVTGGGPTDLHVTWATESAEVNPNANALRWATLYNFRFDADVPPGQATLTIGMFRPGAPASVSFTADAPSVCDNDGTCDLGENCTNCPSDCSGQGGGGGCCGDGTCDPGETSCSCLADCGPSPDVEFLCGNGEDDDCDGLADCADFDCCSDAGCGGPDGDGDGFQACDCDDTNNQAWATPGPVANLQLDHDSTSGQTTLSWGTPLNPGGTALTYSTVRSENPTNFSTSTTCLVDGDPTDTGVVDLQAPALERTFYYLVRAENGCPVPAGLGDVGRNSDNVPREARSCP